MATIHEDIQKGADWIARALSSSGYRADFSSNLQIQPRKGRPELSPGR
jgi:hypothetical protein